MASTSQSMLPPTVMAALNRAQSALQFGRAADAWTALAPLRAQIDRHSQALRLYALAAQQTGRTDEAIDALKRIQQLERDPPEIIGALADTLGRAGRHDEALPLWDRLAILQPMIADAHLNRAISATNAGKPDRALAAAEEGLKRFPDHPRLQATRAVALKNQGRLVEALEGFAVAAAAEPDRALTHFNWAVTLRAARRFDEASEAFARAGALGLKGAQFDATWAATELERGDVSRALELYRRALAEDPGHDEAMQALTRLHTEYSTGDDPFAHYEARARSVPDDGDAWLNWANALAVYRDYERAHEVAREAAHHHPDRTEFETLALFAGGMSGDPERPALALVDRLRAQPDNELLWVTLSQLGLRAGLPDVAAGCALSLIDLYPHHQTAWSLVSLAWRVLGDEREHWLCDYDRHVMTIDVPPPDHGLSPTRYADDVAAMLRKRHNTLAAPGNQSLRHGTQTPGSLFEDPDPDIQRFHDAVRLAAIEALRGLDDDPRHPFLSRKTADVGFSGSWSVRLQEGSGHHVPHYHSEGWMSSAYYAALPPATAEGNARHEGWIEFGRSPEIFKLDLAPRRRIEPVEGRLVLFPSFMWHGTVPFPKGERLTAAFDYQPLP